jgi:D-arabinono-1,4-lactone oxidase
MSSAGHLKNIIMNPAVAAELEKFEDDIPFRARANYAHATWARTFYSSPELYIRPQSLEEIQKAVNLARRCRKRITTTGCGHSPSDITCTSSWLMNLDDYNKILSVDQEKGVVVLQSGIRLYQLGEELDKLGLAMPNLGSINEQSIAGAISTGTHGSTLRHGLVSESILALRIVLSNGQSVLCSPTQNESLFRASLISLGALGIICEITFKAVPAYTLKWNQTINTDAHMLSRWNTDLWTKTEFIRVWWFPYTRRATIWTAEKTNEPIRQPPRSYYEGWLGYQIYHNLLYVSQWVPRILPWVEWFVFGMTYGFKNGSTVSGIQPSRQALLMNCLYSQWVNEWAIPLEKGPEALARLSSWLNQLPPSDPQYVEHGIPVSAEGLYVHAPLEVRVTDGNLGRHHSSRPLLDITSKTGPTLYLNATLYRPYDTDPPCRARYYEGFEYLMRELGGKPHWAKNFETTATQFEDMFGDDLVEWRQIRAEADPEGMFVGDWHRRYLLGDTERFPLEETEVGREQRRSGGTHVLGKIYGSEIKASSSEESFDVLHGGEASV